MPENTARNTPRSDITSSWVRHIVIVGIDIAYYLVESRPGRSEEPLRQVSQTTLTPRMFAPEIVQSADSSRNASTGQSCTARRASRS